MAMRRPAGRILIALSCLFGADAALSASPAAEVTVREVAAPYPSASPALNEVRTARPGEPVYTERATGLPGARLTEPLTLDKTPAGRKVTIKPDEDLPKYLVDGAPHYCVAHALPFNNNKRREAAFYICLRDGDGSPGAFEEVRIITVVLEIVDRKYLGRTVHTTAHRTHELTASGRISPKAYVETTIDPDGGDYYEAVVRLTAIEGGAIEFRSELRDRAGRRGYFSGTVKAPLSGPFPLTVSVPHPFEGEKIYSYGGSADEKDKAEKQAERAAVLEILGVEGGAVTYRVVRSFMPWRYWTAGRGRKERKLMRWRPRPENRSFTPPASAANEIR